MCCCYGLVTLSKLSSTQPSLQLGPASPYLLHAGWRLQQPAAGCTPSSRSWQPPPAASCQPVGCTLHPHHRSKTCALGHRVACYYAWHGCVVPQPCALPACDNHTLTNHDLCYSKCHISITPASHRRLRPGSQAGWVHPPCLLRLSWLCGPAAMPCTWHRHCWRTSAKVSSHPAHGIRGSSSACGGQGCNADLCLQTSSAHTAGAALRELACLVLAAAVVADASELIPG